ncbi:MAG: hypothetical protein ACI4XF_07420, partial [Oscillospiraceae bacterium]
ISDVKVILDGNTKYTFDEAFLSPDEPEYLQPMMINIWNSDLGGQDGLFGYTMPQDSIEIQFTVSGLGAAEASDEAAEETTEEAAEETTAEETTDAPASDETTAPAETGNASAAAIAAVMAAAGAAAVLSKKRN